MNKLPKISYEVLEQAIKEFNKSFGDKISIDNLKQSAKKYLTELKNNQPAIFDWAVSIDQAYRVANLPITIGELILIIVVFYKSLQAQIEVNGLDEMFNE